LYVRRGAVVLTYAVVLYVCRWLAYQLRFEFEVPVEFRSQLFNHVDGYIPAQLVLLAAFGQFSGVMRYFGIRDALRLLLPLALASLCFIGVRHFLGLGYTPPRGVIFIHGLLSFIALGGLRASWRLAYERRSQKQAWGDHSRHPLGIVGAGDAGASLIRELQARPHRGLVPVALFDDDSSKWHSEVYGVPVVGAPETMAKWKAKFGLEEIVIAMPLATGKRIREVAELAQKTGLRTVRVPSVGELASGQVRVSRLRPVNIEDVLGRDPVELPLDDVKPLLAGRVVMVTGAGGSIGSELCRQIARLGPQRLLLVEQAEGHLFLIEQELIKLGHEAIILPLVADIVDQARMKSVLAEHRPQVIFHAAAHKHVFMMERQPGEAIKNNAFGTAALAELAQAQGVEHFVLISTDKAVNPSSVMGATKRLAELYLQGLFHAQPERTKFIAVRFGNVLGSSGSVVPIFTQQIAEGGPVTVTHREVVRYFMTIPEAVGLVLHSFALGTGGEIFVLEMGSQVKIADMARTMIKLSGFEPDRDIEIVFTGLRPGEKLFEELAYDGTIHAATTHPRIKRLKCVPTALAKLRTQFESLRSQLPHSQPDDLREALQRIIPEYHPSRPETILPPAGTPKRIGGNGAG
jgi:FlaA1/EpsC-like NDP-sugar epimerase